MNRTVRLLPALAVGAALVVTSSVGTATAASMITGAQVKDGSLSRADLRTVSRTSVVATKASSAVDLEQCADTSLATCKAVRSIGIVPGSQLVTATLTIDNTAKPMSTPDVCGLFQGGKVLTETRFLLAGNDEVGEVTQLTLQRVVTLPDASVPVSLRCTEMPDHALRVESADLTSVRSGY